MLTAGAVSEARVRSGTADPATAAVTRFWPWFTALSLGAVIGIACIALSYARSTYGESGQYPLFYLGLMAFMVPAVLLLMRGGTGRTAHLGVTAAIGLFLYAPKLLRDPFGPLYHDELAHWRQTSDIAAAGHLFVPNTTIPIISSYPGLHILTLTLDRLTGLSVWGSSIALLATLHVVDLLAVFLIVERMTSHSRAGALGALLFALNPSFMYFDDQFGYESLGITFFLLCIVALQRAERAEVLSERRGWSFTAIVCGACCAVTHHLSTVVLCGVLVIWVAAANFQQRRGRRAPASARAVTVVGVSVVAVFVLWLVLVAPGTFTYLKPYVGNAIHQLTAAASGGGGNRTPFAQATNPIWERLAAFASPLVTLIAAAATVLYLWRADPQARYPAGLRMWPGTFALLLFGLFYFPSIPFLLAPSGAEGARRSWGFTYLGVAAILAPTIYRWLQQRPRPSGAPVRAKRYAVFIGFLIVLVGNVGAGLDPTYRFPGPYAFGSDSYTLTPELRTLSDWFAIQAGPGNLVVADRFTGLALGALGRQDPDAPSTGFPTYQLYLDHTPPSGELTGELEGSGYAYLVVDKRMVGPVSTFSTFFTGGSDTSSDGTVDVTPGTLDRFATYPWMSRVYESTDYVVYHFHFGDLRVALSPKRG